MNLKKSSRDTKYPFLTAWIGLCALTALVSLAGELAFVFVESDLLSIVRLGAYVVVSFFLFRAMIERHILPSVQLEAGEIRQHDTGISARYPYLTAWVGFITISVILGLMADYLTALMLTTLMNDGAIFLIGYLLDLIVGFFIFKFVVRRHVLPVVQGQAMAEFKEENG